MFVMPSQTANGSTLLEVKKGSSVVISTGSNNRMQRSARSEIVMIPSVFAARPLIRSVGRLRVTPAKRLGECETDAEPSAACSGAIVQR